MHKHKLNPHINNLYCNRGSTVSCPPNACCTPPIHTVHSPWRAPHTCVKKGHVESTPDAHRYTACDIQPALQSLREVTVHATLMHPCTLHWWPATEQKQPAGLLSSVRLFQVGVATCKAPSAPTHQHTNTQADTWHTLDPHNLNTQASPTVVPDVSTPPRHLASFRKPLQQACRAQVPRPNVSDTTKVTPNHPHPPNPQLGVQPASREVVALVRAGQHPLGTA